LQITPQFPQFVTVVVLVSQPLLMLPSQLLNPIAHTGLHAPIAHEVVPFMLVHCVPHVPQFEALVAVLASQPSPYMPLQFW
jgi:hypothetical protein